MIERRNFLKVMTALGLTGVPRIKHKSSFDGTVIVIGAGVAGMSVGHLLAQQGVRFRILEAGPSFGGRVKTVRDFVDFPIPLGGEWIHVDEEILSRIINDDSIKLETRTTAYVPELTYAYFEPGNDPKLRTGNVGNDEDYLVDKKFVNDTWLTFFEKHIVPRIKAVSEFNKPVASVDYSNERVEVTCADDSKHLADAVVVTVPPQTIKDGDLAFKPDLPKRKRRAFADAYIWGGMKVFLQFKEKFYPTFLEFADANNDRGQKMYYDAAYGQNSKANVLGLFTVGDQSKPYQSKVAGELRDFILAELDEIFEGDASRNYIKHVAQNWNEEKFIRQAYFANSADWRLPPRMRESIDDKVFFAGDTYTNGEDWGSAHAAAISAREAVDELLS